ncbi:unnamed protein product [Calicophoron daubneyi]
MMGRFSAFIEEHCKSEHGEISPAFGLFIQDLFCSIQLEDFCIPAMFLSLLFERYGVKTVGALVPLQIKALLAHNYSIGDDEQLRPSDVVDHLRRWSHLLSGTLFEEFNRTPGLSPRHLQLDNIRLAYRLTVNAVGKAGPCTDESFKAAFEYLVTVEATNRFIWDCCICYFTDLMFSALSDLHTRAKRIACSQLIASDKMASSDLKGENSELVRSMGVELQNFGKRAMKFAQIESHPTSDSNFADSLFRLVCSIYDQVATLIFYDVGLRQNIHRVLWDILYGDRHSQSVERWCEFWLGI